MSSLMPVLVALLAFSATFHAREAKGFCGFYVGKADSKIFNKASQVVLVRDGEKNVLTMASDFQGDLSEFALVVPVPIKLEKNQIHVGENKLVERIDAFTSPRLVEYFDSNPCRDFSDSRRHGPYPMPMPAAAGPGNGAARAKSLGVTIDARYEVGEYDILILSATQSSGLETWLNENGYKVPAGASPVLGDYIKNDMKFFVAKVNLKRKSKDGYSQLNPIQMAFATPKFILPLRLGTLNSTGTQDLFVYAITKSGRVEPTNYRMTRIPTGHEVPVFVKSEFKEFYKDMFTTEVKKEDMRTVFLEYAWNMASCDPCSADPLSNEELQKLGVFWLGETSDPIPTPGRIRPTFRPFRSSNVFVTRLHIRYDADHFPEDLGLQVTGNSENFQGRYVLRHAWQGTEICEALSSYKQTLSLRHEKEAVALASLTGWDINKIRAKMDIRKADEPKKDKNWWDDIWPK